MRWNLNTLYDRVQGLAKLVSRGPISKMLLPACGGLPVGAIAVFYPQVIGVGYETTDLALNGGFGPDIILLTTLVLAKILASALSLESGFRGGVFSPSLCIGALSGAAFGLAVATILPRIDVNPNDYSVVRMGVVAGAVLGAPISTFLIIFQLTGDFGLTV
ncbi:MAG: H(+)/Cl(-) exchange transporter ClcA, partial [Alphaproteobacteria bacterium MarineAlpha9_Bin6]